MLISWRSYVQRLRDAGVGAKEISVLTPYNAQVDKLRLRLLPLHPGLEIGYAMSSFWV